MSTVRLTMAQALVRYLCNQFTIIEGKKEPLFAGLFGIFLLNVTLGAARIGAFLGDIGEMLVLFGFCILFVIAILGFERRAREAGRDVSKQGGET